VLEKGERKGKIKNIGGGEDAQGHGTGDKRRGAWQEDFDLGKVQRAVIGKG